MPTETVRRTGRLGYDDPTQSRWKGIAAPFIRQPKGFFEPKGTRDVIWSSIVNILMTPLGTRIWLPEFGSKLPELVFEPNDDILQGLARQYIFEALERWEPRIILRDAEVFRDQFNDQRLHVRMSYEIIGESFLETRTLPVSRGVDRNVERIT